MTKSIRRLGSAYARCASIGALAAALVAVCAPAQGQSIDYRALEEIFGEPVTTSVTGSPQRASQVPASMIIVTAEDIRRSGARDIPGILRHVPGVDVLQWGNDNADVSVRGFNQVYSPRLLVLIDGRQVYADYYGFTPWSTLPVELGAIRQIEIVKGPNSALFGFNAVSGVVNIITNDALDDEIRSVSVTGGTQDLLQGSLVGSAKLSRTVGLRLLLGANTNEDFSTPQDPIDLRSRRGNERFIANLTGTWRPGEATEATVEATHSESELPEFGPGNAVIYESYRTGSLAGTVATDTRLGLLQARLYGNWIESAADVANLTGTPVLLQSRVIVAQLQDLFQIGTRHTIRIAAEYRRNQMETTPVEGGKVFYGVVSTGAMWGWQIVPTLSWTNAVRLDHLSLGRSGSVPPGYGLSNAEWNRRSLNEPSFNTGLVWEATDLDTFRLTAARGVQIPSLVALGGTVIQFPFGFSSGNPSVDPTETLHYELGWDRQVPAWGGRLRVAGFYDTTGSVLSILGGTLLSAGIISTSANIGDTESYGVEVSIDGRFLESWRWQLSYTPQVVRDHFLPAYPVAVAYTDFENTTPEHSVNASLGWSRGAWEVDGFGRYQSGFDGVRGLGDSAFLVRIPAHFSLDGRIGYRLSRNVTLALSGQNLLQDEQRQTAISKVERRLLGTLTLDF